MLEKMLDRAFMNKMAMKVRKRYVDHIFLQGKDVFGRKFKGYSTNVTKWASILARKNERKNIPKEGLSYGQAKKRGILQRQSRAFSDSTAPVLTGDFMNDCKPFSTSNSFGIKWAAFGARVEHLAKRNRKVTTKSQPFPEPILKMIGVDINKEVKRKLPKSKTIRVKLGK